MAETATISPALSTLLDIMTSDTVAEAQCIEAARAIIEYEAPEEVFAITRAYLMGVAQDADQPVTLKLKALELIRKVEAKRVVPGTAKAADTARGRALGLRLATARKRMELVRDRAWPAPRGWEDDLGEMRVPMIKLD